MNIVSPADWGARVDYTEWADQPHYAKTAIAVHYGGPAVKHYDQGVGAEGRVLRSWEAFHMDSRGWRGLAYGYGIGATGTCYMIRGGNHYGAHLGDHDQNGIPNNYEVVPVVLILGAGQPATPQMWETLGHLKTRLEQENHRPLPVYGHREIQPKPTTCPGDLIMAGIERKAWTSAWEKPADPILLHPRDTVKVARYQGGKPQSDTMSEITDPAAAVLTARLLDLAMQHDMRLRQLERKRLL